MAEKQMPDSSFLEECQKQLRSLYEISSKVQIVPWDETSAVDIDEVYTTLSWLMDEKKPSGVAQKKLENYTDIFDGGRLHRTPKRILVHGRPGMGKTVFTQKATYDWSKHRFKGKLGRFDLVLLVKLRDVCDLQDVPAILRASKLLASDGLVSFDDLYDYVRRHQDKVLLILDGYDEYAYVANRQSPVREIWEKKQLWDCCVVITSRNMNGEGLENGSDAQFQIDGFDRDRKEEFARKFLKDDQDVEEFFEYLNQQELEDVTKIPLLLLILCLVWKEKDLGGLPSRAKVYFQFIQTLFNHMASKGLEEGDAVTFTDVNDYKEELCEIGKQAFYALLQDSLYFPASKLPDHVLTTKLIKVGLFQLLNMSALNPCKEVHFIHKSLQEYLASLFLTHELLAQKDKNNSLFKVDSVEKTVKMTEVFKFAVELSEEAAREIVVHLTGMAAKKDGLTEYSFDNESPTVRDLSAEQENYLDLCTKLLFCCSADARKELFPTFLSSLGGVLVITPKQLNVTVTENLLKTAAPLIYIFFSSSKEYTEQDYHNLITLTQQLNAVIVSCSGETKASEFLQKYPWRSTSEFFLKRELFNTRLYFSQIVKSPQNGLPFQMINALISLVEATNKTKVNPGGESSEQACSTHALCRVWRIEADDVNRSEVELLSDVLPFVLAPQWIQITGEDDAEFDRDITKKILSAINPTNKLKALTLRKLNVRSSAAGFIATIFKESRNLEILDLSDNPKLGEGVDAISKHLRSTPHLEQLRLEGVKMTKEQFQQLSEAAMKHSSIATLGTDYHETSTQTKGRWTSPLDFLSLTAEITSLKTELKTSQQKVNTLLLENEKLKSKLSRKSSVLSFGVEKDEEGSIEPEDEGSSAESDDPHDQIQTELEQVSTSSSSLNTRPSFRDAPFTVQVLASSGDEESPRKTEKGKKREAHWVTEGDQGSSRKRKKREKHKVHRATEGNEESPLKTKERKKHETRRMAEDDEGSSRKTKKREKHKAHRVTEGDEEYPRKRKKKKKHRAHWRAEEKKPVLEEILSSAGVEEEEIVVEEEHDVKAVSVQATEVESQGVITEESSEAIKLFNGIVTSEGAHWAVPLGAVHLTFPPNAVSEPTSVVVHRWKYSIRSPPLQEHEVITSNVIELSSMDDQGLKFNTKVKLSLSHSATHLRGYELVIKRLTDIETNTWEEVDGTRDIRYLQEIKDDHPSYMEIPNSFFPLAQAVITECSTYAVLCRLKSSPTYTITSNGGSFSHPDFSGITVTIPENAVGPDAKFPLALKVQEVPSDDFQEKGVLLGPILRIDCFEVLHFLRSVTIQLPISLEDQQLLNPDPATSCVRVLFLKSDGKKKEWIEITDDLVTRPRFDGKFVRFQVERFSGYTCWVHSLGNIIHGLGITRYYNSLVYVQPRQVVFVAGFRPRNFNVLCLLCCLTHLKKQAVKKLREEEGNGIEHKCVDSIEDMIPGRGWAFVSVSGGIRLFDERDAGNLYLRLYGDDKPPFKAIVEVRWMNDQDIARVKIRTLKPTGTKSPFYTKLLLEMPTDLEERARQPRAVSRGNPTNDELEDLSEQIADKWKKLGRRLNFDDAKLLEFNRNEELAEKAYTMLMAWKRRDALDATYNVLDKALRHKHVGRNDLAEKFCRH